MSRVLLVPLYLALGLAAGLFVAGRIREARDDPDFLGIIVFAHMVLWPIFLPIIAICWMIPRLGRLAQRAARHRGVNT